MLLIFIIFIIVNTTNIIIYYAQLPDEFHFVKIRVPKHLDGTQQHGVVIAQGRTELI